MSISFFDKLLRRLKDSLQRRNSKMKNCIQPVEMLTVPIRYMMFRVCFERKIRRLSKTNY